MKHPKTISRATRTHRSCSRMMMIQSCKTHTIGCCRAPPVSQIVCLLVFFLPRNMLYVQAHARPQVKQPTKDQITCYSTGTVGWKCVVYSTGATAGGVIHSPISLLTASLLGHSIQRAVLLPHSNLDLFFCCVFLVGAARNRQQSPKSTYHFVPKYSDRFK